MSGGKKKKSTSSSTQTIEAPSYIRDDLVNISNEAKRLYDEGFPEYYDGETVAAFTPQQQQAIDLTTQRALDGSPLVDEAQNFATDLASGAYQDNPYLNDYLDVLGRQINQRTAQSFNASNRVGSGANVDTASRAITEASLPFLLNQYNTGINQRLQASQLAPTLAREDYYDISKLAGAGEAQQIQDQRFLDEAANEYYYNAQRPYNALNEYANLIYTSPANQHTTTTGTTTNTQSGGSALGSIGGLVTAGVGLATGNPALIAGGVSSAAGGGGSGFSGGGFGGGFSSLFSG